MDARVDGSLASIRAVDFPKPVQVFARLQHICITKGPMELAKK